MHLPALLIVALRMQMLKRVMVLAYLPRYPGLCFVRNYKRRELSFLTRLTSLLACFFYRHRSVLPVTTLEAVRLSNLHSMKRVSGGCKGSLCIGGIHRSTLLS